MKTRSVVTLSISVVFVTLMSTGILLYALPWSYLVGAIHIWASIFFIVGTFWHFKNNLKPYLSHLQKKAGKKTLFGCGLGVLAVVMGIMFNVAPFSSVMVLGEDLRTRGQPETSQYTLLDLAGSEELPRLNLFIKAGSAYESAPQPIFLGFTYTSVPQIAVWMETLEGEYIDTLYVTGKISESDFGSNEAGEKRRPEALPYWSHSRGIQEDDGYFAPSSNNTDLDGITAATPKQDALVSMTAPRMGRYRLMLEVNRSYDFNEYYSKDRFADDPIYSGDGSSGQPSLVYSVTIDSQKTMSSNADAAHAPSVSNQYLFNLIGHGHHSGADGKLYTDLDKITSAKEILSFIVAEVEL